MCYFYVVEKLKFKQIGQIVDLSRNQMKDAVQSFKKGNYSTIQEKRGRKPAHSEKDLEMTQKMIDNTLRFHKGNTTLKEIEALVQESQLNYKPKKSEIHRIMSKKLKYRFKKCKRSLHGECTPYLREYRRYFAAKLTKMHCKNFTFFAIDECSFSKFKEIKTWACQKDPEDFKRKLKKDERNVTLLLCVTQYEVFDYMLLDCAVNSVIYYHFLRSVMNKIKHRGFNPKKVMITMDNARVHFNEVILSLIHEHQLKVFFTPPYSPQLHFVEFVFGEIKRQMRKIVFKDQKQ